VVKKHKNNKSSVHQPHDKLVKKLLSSPSAAGDILSLYLPKEVLEIVDLNHLELQKDSFIDDEHRAYAVDLLYKTTFQGKEGYIWLLLEHQRKSQHWMPVRIFKYIAIIWDHLRRTSKSRSIPLVYPLIIYNGDKPYKHSLNLSDLIEPEASKKIFANLFTEPFCLIDLPSIEDETLRQAAQDRVKGIALLMTLKHTFDKNLQTFFDQTLVSLLKRLDKAGDTDDVADVLYYLLKEGELDEEQFWAVFHREFSKEVEGKMTTIAQKMEQRAIEKRNIEIAEQLLSEKMGLSDNDLVSLIKRVTGLSEDKIKKIKEKH
jgi:predicted transposase/invertase (TIGR01784 family)